MKLKVREKILLITVTIVLLTVSANTLVVGRMFKKAYSDALQSKMDVIANTLKLQIERLLELGISAENIEGFEAQCQEAVRQHSEVAYTMVVGMNGEILFHNVPARHGTMIKDRRILDALQECRQTSCLSDMDGRIYYNSLIPVTDYTGNYAVGVIVGFPMGFVDGRIQEFLDYSSVLALIFLGLAVVLLLIGLSVLITRPLHTLVAAIHEIRQNWDLESRVNVKSNDEIGELAKNFNLMLEDLDRTTVSRDALMKEVVEREKAEEALLKGDERFKQVAENAGDWIWEVDSDGLFTYSNSIVENILGYSPDEIVGKKYFYDFFPPDSRESMKKGAFKVFAGRESFKYFVNENMHKNGSVVLIETNGTPITDDDGNLCGYRGVDRDVTERKKADEALRTKEAQLSNAMKIANLGYWEYDLADDQFIFNDRFYDIYHTTAEQVGGYKMKSSEYAERFVHPEDRQIVPMEIQRVIKTTDPKYNRQLEHRIIYADGRVGYVSVRFFIIKDEQGRTVKTFGANQDITERKQAEEALNDLNEKLLRSNQQLQEFTYVASHDLREPIRKINSFGQMLAESIADKLDEDDKENLSFMIDGAERMQQMIEALLIYSRVNTKGVESERVDLNEVVEQLKELELAVKFEETNANIIVSEPLPEVFTDPAQVRQLMQNLVSNALKYHKKDVVPEIIIRAKTSNNNMVRVEVQDNGIGIEEDKYKDVFVMFRRLHSRSEYEGTGIGLAVCKRIVERHGGQIGVASTYGEGSTFWFTIPAATVQSEKTMEMVSSKESLN